MSSRLALAIAFVVAFGAPPAHAGNAGRAAGLSPRLVVSASGGALPAEGAERGDAAGKQNAIH